MAKRSKITRTAIEQATDDRSWQRGVTYYSQGRVQSLMIDGDEIIAKVSGTRNYRVKLEILDSDIEGDCSCPMGAGGYFCKHCVAVGLAYLDGEARTRNSGEPEKKTKQQRNSARVTMDDVRQYLSSRKKGELVDMLIMQVKQNDRLRDKLFLLLATDGKGKIAMETFREAIDEATSIPDFEYGDYYRQDSRDISDVVDSIEGLLEHGHAEEVMELAEFAIDSCDIAMEHLDDSDGGMYCAIERLMCLFHQACQKIKPYPEELARKLFTLGLQNSWFCRAIREYESILGKEGMSVYRKLAFEEWDKVPSLTQDDEKDYGGPRNRITSIMESLAEMDNDIEMQVAIKSKTLTNPWDYLKIAGIYKENRLTDKALQWAEKAVEVFGRESALRFVGDFLAEEYHHRKRHDEAMKIVWDDFQEHASLKKYQNLKKHADRCKQWKQWRLKALEYVEAEIGKGMRKDRRSRWSFPRFSDHSVLVEIFLWEKSPERAWQEAQTGGCSTNLWLKLAKQRESKHSDDSIRIYRSVIEPIVERTNNDAYQEATGYIKSIKKLMVGQEKMEEFESYLVEIKTKFKRKRNFMKMLEKVQ